MSTSLTEPPVSSRPESTPADVWRRKAIHTITVPTGAVLRIRIPGISTLLQNGALPENLIGLAMLDLSTPKGAAHALRELLDRADDPAERTRLLEEVGRFAEYQRRIVAAALVEPALSYEEVAAGDLPEEDLAMVADIVQRLSGTDARGVRIGVEPLEEWARFHHHHGLPADGRCDGCLGFIAELSSIDVGAL